MLFALASSLPCFPFNVLAPTFLLSLTVCSLFSVLALPCFFLLVVCSGSSLWFALHLFPCSSSLPFHLLTQTLCSSFFPRFYFAHSPLFTLYFTLSTILSHSIIFCSLRSLYLALSIMLFRSLLLPSTWFNFLPLSDSLLYSFARAFFMSPHCLLTLL